MPDFKVRPTVNGVNVLLEGEAGGSAVWSQTFNGTGMIRMNLPVDPTNNGRFMLDITMLGGHFGPGHATVWCLMANNTLDTLEWSAEGWDVIMGTGIDWSNERPVIIFLPPDSTIEDFTIKVNWVEQDLTTPVDFSTITASIISDYTGLGINLEGGHRVLRYVDVVDEYADMRKSVYDTDNDGKVEHADYADNAQDAANASFAYGAGYAENAGKLGDVSAASYMLKSIYDSNNNGVVDQAEFANEAGDAETLGGKHVYEFPDQLVNNNQSINVVSGHYYKIASSTANESHFSGLFDIRWEVSGQHGRALVALAQMYGTTPRVTVINASYYNTSVPFDTISLVYHPTYAGNTAYVYLHCNNAATGLLLSVRVMNPWDVVIANPITDQGTSLPGGYIAVTKGLDMGRIDYADSTASAAYATNADKVDNVHINNDGAQAYGPNRLYRGDSSDQYFVSSTWDGTYWVLAGYYDSRANYHAGVRVAYCDNAYSAYYLRNAAGPIWVAQNGPYGEYTTTSTSEQQPCNVVYTLPWGSWTVYIRMSFYAKNSYGGAHTRVRLTWDSSVLAEVVEGANTGLNNHGGAIAGFVTGQGAGNHTVKCGYWASANTAAINRVYYRLMAFREY